MVGIAYAKDLIRTEREARGNEPVGDHVRERALRSRDQAGRET